MRKKTYDETICIDNRILPINTSGGTKPSYVEILHTIDDQLTAMLSHHSKVLMVRLDVHVHDIPENNSIMTDFIDRIRRWAYGRYDKVDKMGYVWCRELSSDKDMHYHVMLMFNGHAVLSSYHILKKARQIVEHHQHRGYRCAPYFTKKDKEWEKSKYPARHHIMIQRGDSFSYSEAFHWASYLAKERTKDKKVKTSKTNNYQSSRIDHKVSDYDQMNLLDYF